MAVFTSGPTRANPGPPRLPTFEELASRPDGEIDVALGAMLIARDVYADLDCAALVRQLDDLAAPLASSRLARAPAEEQAARLAEHLYGREGFQGNEADYYDPKNSLLPDVLGRRLGIPITLALVYTEVAARLGIPAFGIGFPGHFLVGIERGDPPDAPLIVDAFFGGRVLSEDALASLVRRAVGPRETPRPEYLAPATPRDVLTRMLSNLKTNYLSRGEDARALLVLDRLVTLCPESSLLLRERGVVAARLGMTEVAREDLSRCLEMSSSNVRQVSAIHAQLLALGAGKRPLN